MTQRIGVRELREKFSLFLESSTRSVNPKSVAILKHGNVGITGNQRLLFLKLAIPVKTTPWIGYVLWP